MKKKSVKTNTIPVATGPVAGYNMGIRTGYDYRDGKYYLAPTHTQGYDNIVVEAEALERMMTAHNNYVQTAMIAYRKKVKWWFRQVAEDLGLDGQNMEYFSEGGYLKIIPDNPVTPPKDETTK